MKSKINWAKIAAHVVFYLGAMAISFIIFIFPMMIAEWLCILCGCG